MADPELTPSLAVMNFSDDLKAASAVADAARWKLEYKGGLELWANVSPREAAGENFIARLFWADYPGNRPPSVKFVDSATGRLDVPKAWPKANGFRPASLDICANWTAEGFNIHPEWAQTDARWVATGNVILRVLRILQSELDASFAGRFDG
jgi:hypothetical protein